MRIHMTLRNENDQEGNTWYSGANDNQPDVQLHVPREVYMTNVAKLTHDHLDKKKGELGFSWEGFYRFWSGQNFGEDSGIPSEDFLHGTTVVDFRLYDDDGELYYSGWLKDDSWAMVQQFVLAWAMADSGCTTITVKRDGKWVQEIG